MVCFFVASISNHMTTEKKSEKSPRKKISSRGGARPGSGRPKGSTTKVSLDDLLSNIELATGQTYGELLAHNYAGAIARSDWSGVRDYDKAFMNKLLADKTEVTTIDTQEALEAKHTAFAEALRQITGNPPRA
jgi:hypothetical protein